MSFSDVWNVGPIIFPTLIVIVIATGLILLRKAMPNKILKEMVGGISIAVIALSLLYLVIYFSGVWSGN